MVNSLAHKNLYETPGISSSNTTESMMHTNNYWRNSSKLARTRLQQLKDQFKDEQNKVIAKDGVI